mgnify:CR=1 FL=1
MGYIAILFLLNCKSREYKHHAVTKMALMYIFFVFFVHVCHNNVMNKEELNYLHDMINQRLDQDGQKYEMACAYAEQAAVDLQDIIGLRNLGSFTALNLTRS